MTQMLFLVVALLVMAMLLGTAAYAPWPVTVTAAAVIALWLAVFAMKERRRRNSAGSA
ncbi:hypothetical protein ABZ532_22405 [Streptomyces sp. NPDC019396]|uniref:hypothetical protein n=1 Tax=Streptomyces sp. NPDC019396 TaxID=3154687 RepID=UPI0033D2F467